MPVGVPGVVLQGTGGQWQVRLPDGTTRIAALRGLREDIEKCHRDQNSKHVGQ